MKNKLSQKLFTLTLLSILLISISYTCMMPSAAASEPTASQKSLNILQEVFGLKLDKYNITTQEDTTSFPWLGNTVQENIYCTLTSAECKFRLIFTFVDGNLLNMCVFENQGVSELKQATNNLESAQAFLNNYQKYNTNPLFSELKASLNNVEINKNYTKTVGDKILEITVYEGVETVFMWYYSVNGATAPYTKLVSLSFNDGYLTAFNDKWNLYSIGNTEVTLSKETAITIALETAKNHNWTMQLGEDVFDPTRFNPQQSVSWVSLNFDGSLEADNPRSENILELYPVWRVGIVFNEVFGELYGAEVDIWADTQTIRSVHEEHSALAANWFKNNTPHEDQTIPPEPVVSSLSVVPGQIAFMCILMGLSGMFMIILLKKRLLTGLPHFKRFSAKVLSVLFGSLLLLLIFLPLVETASASSAGVIWASHSAGAPNSPYSYSWRKMDGEINKQTSVESYLASNGFTSANGYSVTTNYGANKPLILYQAQYLSTNYDHVSVVVFDHGVIGYPGRVSSSSVPYNEEHYMFEDDWGTVEGSPSVYQNKWEHGVYDVDIYDAFPAGKVHFAFINTCYSANVVHLGQGYSASGHALGLPFAFTHRMVGYVPIGSVTTTLSDDGYARPDAFPQCYIGFPKGSAALDQKIPYETNGPQWYQWVTYFFYCALNFDVSVRDSLIWASNAQWSVGFVVSPIRTGFNAVWTMGQAGGIFVEDPGPGVGSSLAVYGNSNIHLRNFVAPHMVTRSPISGPLSGAVGVAQSFSVSSVDSYGHKVRYIFDWADGTSTTTGYYTAGVPVSVSHAWSTDGGYDVKVYAECEYGCSSGWSMPYTALVGNNPWLTVEAWDDYGNSLPVDVYVDGKLIDSAPVSLMVKSGLHTVSVDWQIYTFVILDHFSDGYNNGDYRTITSNTTITAYYRCTK